MLMIALWLTMAPAFPAQLRTAKRSHAKRAQHHTTSTRSRAAMSSHARRRPPSKPATKRTHNTNRSRQKARNIA